MVKNKVPKTTTQRDQSSSTGLSAEAEQALIDKISNSVVDKLKNDELQNMKVKKMLM